MGRQARVMAAFLVCGIVLAGVFAGCGGDPEPALPVDVPPPKDASARVTIYLLKGEEPTAAERTVAYATPSAGLALNELLRGPTPGEEGQGLTTAIPAGTQLNSFTVDGGVAKVDFSKEMASFGGGSALVQAIIMQVGRTVTANDPSVTSVLITVDGVPAEEALQP